MQFLVIGKDGKDKKEISIEKIQKYFNIGYSRAARIMDHLKEDGLIETEMGF